VTRLLVGVRGLLSLLSATIVATFATTATLIWLLAVLLSVRLILAR